MPVTSKVTLNGQPVTGAGVTFTPVIINASGNDNGNGFRIFDIDMNGTNSTATLTGLTLTKPGVFPLIPTFALAA